MTQEKMKGKGNEAVGGAKEKVGEVTGDRDMEAEGEAQKDKGKVQGAWGDVKDKAEDLKDKVT